ncbi:glutaredoxin family protein [Actinotalea sp. K2]|uniref:glutaredoxin family protein n=1 Tax=Actinotalea sp. K2 TaxID=2939438 RepID=UPI002016E46F|nr:glutaredoxin family protein [Actinotalea sp. K2]MCL3863062.1 glutaredoxin family protein [Actinotalea sp. K2]
MSAQDPDRLVLYVRAGCHLCEDARVVVEQVAAEAGESWAEVDIQDAGPQTATLVEEYGEKVPVVTVDGVPQGFWRVDAARLHRALQDGRGRR